MQIFIKDLRTGLVHAIDVTKDYSIFQTKERAQRKFGYNATQFELIFLGKIMLDQETLSSEGINSGDNLLLVMKPNRPDAGCCTIF